MSDTSAIRPRRIARLGWIPDLPDRRDFAYAAPPAVLASLPPMVDLRPQCPPVVDQLALGACTSNAIAGAFQFEQMKQGGRSYAPSRLFIYYGERVIEGTVDSDSGAMLRDGMKVIAHQGAPPESLWSYDIARFRDPPPAAAYAAGLKDLALQYRRVPRSLAQLKGCLADGYPFVFGFTVYESFESDAVAKGGSVPMPKRGEGVLGGHAVMAVGYDDAASRFLVRNSWGDGWGMAGYFSILYAYLTSHRLASDYWTIRLTEAAAP